MSQLNKTIHKFNFEAWLREHQLSAYKQIFIDAEMADPWNLDMNDTAFARLITDERFGGDQQIIERVISAIRALQQPAASPADDYKDSSSTALHEDVVTELVEQQYHELSKLQLILAVNKHKYSKQQLEHNEEKLASYTEKLAARKAKISELFSALQASMQQQHDDVMAVIDQQQKDASLIQSSMDQHKASSNPILGCMDRNERLIERYAQLLHETMSAKQKPNLDISAISRHLKLEYEKILTEFNQNNLDIDQYSNELDLCRLSFPLVNKSVFNQVQDGLQRLMHFEVCCPITVEIFNMNFIKETAVRIEFGVQPQREFKRVEVLYRFDERRLSEFEGFIHDENADDDNKQESRADHEWMIAKPVEKMIYHDSNENVLTVSIKNNHRRRQKCLNIKMRLHAICADCWSPWSNIYSIVDETASPEPQKIKNVFYLSQDLKVNPKGLYVANAATSTSTYCNVFDLKPPHHATVNQREKWTVKYAGLCYAKNVLLPPCIRDIVCTFYDYDSESAWNKKFNCIFKCGGTIGDTLASSYCSAIVFDDLCKYTPPPELEDEQSLSQSQSGLPELKSETSHERSSTDIHSTTKSFAFNWDLPRFPQQTDCNDVTYSQNYGLLSCGGWEFRYDSNKFYRLSFDSEQYFNQNVENLKGDDVNYEPWQWQIMPNMLYKRSWPTILMMDKASKLLAIGGKGPLNTVEMFDFNESKWTMLGNINHARYNAGIFHDKHFSNRVYLGGGQDALNKVEVYDMHKDEWYADLPDTKRHHGSRPVLWIGDNGNLLYIASVYSDSMEYIDLRISNQKYWNLVYGSNYHQLWHDVFETRFAKNRDCRLVLS
eukprot:CAMPEP_0197021730 /NCGR_PEP_ID=MMETSP1384-20130603/2674_1 /TAXON_ID=29189 /ORGANISM="Ammonia sp." /LENGTH=832 /DNA_ID=CAMNT_0042449633 /DNA_START=85 /DNA_END=2583 /DNA_ORIENTATION=+